MKKCAALLGLLVTLGAGTARADPILPAGDPLAALARGFQRQQDVFATAENGLSLDVTFNAADVDKVRAFFAQTASDDFRAVTGKHPFEVMQAFGEHGDEGNFAGIASVGVAARLIALKRDGAPASEIAAARDAAVRAARAWHVFGSIGGRGIAARGVRRTVPLDPGAPPLPGSLPDRVPLKDAQGNPLPAKKDNVWRDPVAPGFDQWIWIDGTSKDQVSGYALAVAWLWDALHDDPAAPAGVADAMAADLVSFVKDNLMKVAPELGVDLCIRDADGRLTPFHDLNPREITPGGVIREDLTLRNGFNAALALGIVRAAYHVSGDPEIGRYYYEELVGRRNFPKNVVEFAGIIFIGPPTNFSNVNMLTIAFATLGRFETDPYVRSQLAVALEHQYWSTGDDRDVKHDGQAWFDLVYGAYATGVKDDIRGRATASLAGFAPAPAIERDVVNCDQGEIDAGICTAIDGVTQIRLAQNAGHNGSLVAVDVVPMNVRPDSDFEWRSDPHRVNGSASTLMDPRGDWLAAYWFGRVHDTDATKNVSPAARPPLPYAFVTPGDDAGAPAAGQAAGGGGCDAAGGGAGTVAAIFAMAASLGALSASRWRGRARR